MNKKIQICKVEYETKNGMQWKATILAYNMQQAINYVRSKVTAFERCNSTNHLGEVDGFTNEVYDDYLTNKTEIIDTVIKEVPVEVIKEVPVEANMEDDLKCVWCKKGFKNLNNLKTHIIKYHCGSEKEG